MALVLLAKLLPAENLRLYMLLTAAWMLGLFSLPPHERPASRAE